MTDAEQVLAFEVAIDATEIAESKTVLVWLDDAKALLALLRSQAAELERLRGEISKSNECVVCHALLVAPETLPHCEDCIVTEEYYER